MQTEFVHAISIKDIPFRLVKISTIEDGNCFFHSVLRSFYVKYINTKNILERVKYATTVRRCLAECLDEKDENGVMEYDKLSNGYLRQFSEECPEASLENMKRELCSSDSVGNIYHELISNKLNIDIYLIDIKKKSVYFTGSDLSLLYKNRNSVFIGYIESSNPKTTGHYEVIGLIENNRIVTLFTYDHPLTLCVRKILSNR